MGKTAKEMTTDEIVADVRRQLQEGRGKLTNAQVFDLLRRLPERPSTFTSADVIRELRGPLPDDDPQCADVDRR